MSILKVLREETLTAGGGTITLVATKGVSLLKLTGSATLTSSWTVTSSGTYSEAERIEVHYNATMVFSGNTLTILDKAIPSYLESLEFWVIATFNGSTWDSYILIDPSVGKTVTGASLVDSTFNADSLVDNTVGWIKMDALDEGRFYIGGPTATPVLYEGIAAGKFLIGDGTTVSPQSITGHVVIDATGAATIQNNVVTEAMLSFTIASGELKVTTITLTQAQVNASNTTPIQILSDAAVGGSAVVSLVGATTKLNFDSAAFTFADDMAIETNSGVELHVISQTKLNGGSDNIWSSPVPSTEVDLVGGSGLRLKAKVSDPTGGGASSTYQISVFYTISVI